MSEVTVDTLREAAKDCEKEGRSAQARLLRVVIADIEDGVPWLEMMNKGVA